MNPEYEVGIWYGFRNGQMVPVDPPTLPRDPEAIAEREQRLRAMRGPERRREPRLRIA